MPPARAAAVTASRSRTAKTPAAAAATSTSAPHLPPMNQDRPLRVAVVGSGPAGFYAAERLLSDDLPVAVDLIERLPTPWGLVRLGVAPDHPELTAASKAFEKTALRQGFR